MDCTHFVTFLLCSKLFGLPATHPSAPQATPVDCVPATKFGDRGGRRIRVTTGRLLHQCERESVPVLRPDRLEHCSIEFWALTHELQRPPSPPHHVVGTR